MGRRATGPYRPAGPTRHDQSLRFIVSELRRAAEFAEQLIRRPDNDSDRQLLVDTAVALEASAKSLAGAPGTIDLERLEQSREAEMRALEREASRLSPTAME